MTRDDVIRMAREAGFSKYQLGGMFDVYLESFAALVAQQEREACARVCERVSRFSAGNAGLEIQDACAAAIRARGAK